MLFNILPDFSENIFLTLSRLQTIYFVFSNPANNFFNISYTRPPEK